MLMKTADESIKLTNEAICENIAKLHNESRGLLSQNILAQLRNLIEHISLKIYSEHIGKVLLDSYDNIKKGNAFIKSNGKYRLISDFYQFLQISSSHYTVDPENSERLMLKYYEYLLRLKQLMEVRYNMHILENLNLFPLNQDPSLKEYYTRISDRLNNQQDNRTKADNDRYYIQKIKPFFVDNCVYYEVTFTRAIDNTSKFDRHIAFTNQEILPNYAVKLELSESYIEICGKKMDIMIIDNWHVSIRPCEFNNLAKIFGIDLKIGKNNEVHNIMSYMTSQNMNLIDVIDLDDEYFVQCKSLISVQSQKLNLWPILESCREMSRKNLPGANIMRYLLYKMNNKIIKAQLDNSSNEHFSGLYLKNKCQPFDDMPFNSSPVGHNPKIVELLRCIDSTEREHELLAHKIRCNTEINSQMYTLATEIATPDILELIKKYNNKLYYGHRPRREIQMYKNHLYINEYEDDCLNILKELKKFSLEKIANYNNAIETWLKNSPYIIDCEEKQSIIKRLFSTSRVALICGAAGTGKTTLLNHISNYWKNEKKIYLANTNPAVENLRRRINTTNTDFKTIHSFITTGNAQEKSCDILFIDECSTVSNSDMIRILNSVNTKLLILVGDIFQIESIQFGNWFNLAQYYLSPKCIFELTTPYRTSNKNLLTLWRKVRDLDNDLIEHLATNGYSKRLNESIFKSLNEDEITLCLNYDGLYGINNLNRFLQNGNPSEAVIWGIETYKVGDPVIFNESNRFSPLIYNNLKGRINNIIKTNETITFDIEVFDASINELNAQERGLELIKTSDSGNPVIRFSTNRLKSTDDDEDSMDTVIPFQVAYAISIHKAQGLEYNSVRIVISNDVEERISHNILYTAITRAKENLTIYWAPETEKRVLENLKQRFNIVDWNIIRSHHPELQQK